MILGVVCSLCLALPAGTPIRTETPGLSYAPKVQLVSAQPESTLADRVAAAAAEHPLAVEVGNEPNLPRYWGGVITPEAYVALYQQARRQARWADPNVPVISAGIADAGSDWRTWIKVIAAAEPDMIGLHPYTGTTATAKWVIQFGKVAVTEIGVSSNYQTEKWRRRYLTSVISGMRKLGVWGTFLYAWDDPNWLIPSGII